jgi:DNA-binding MarR family transcriptional regulator
MITKKMKRNRPSDAAKPDVGAVFSLLERVARRLRDIHRFSVKESGLTPPGFTILRVLWEKDEQSPAALADRSGCTRATMTSLIDNLEKRGLVCRRPNPQDRRGLLVALTAKGRGLREKTPDLDELFGCCCTGLSPDELAQLGALLSKLFRSLEHPSCQGRKETP